MNKIIISIDGEGGDNAPDMIYLALQQAKKKMPNIQWQVFCYEKNAYKFQKLGIQTFICEENDSDTTSTMKEIINSVKEGKAHACVSAGNTMFYLIESVKKLNRLPLIKRPALISSMPSYPQNKV